MILFLDFDGVLHPATADSDRDFFSNNHLLFNIMRGLPDASVVFSTSWKVGRNLEELTRLATRNGGESLANRFIGITPNLEPEGLQGRRDVEIRSWIEANRHGGPWLAIDDMPEMFWGDTTNLYVVNFRTGLIESDVSNIIRIVKHISA